MTRRLVGWFFRGLVLLAPLAVTVYVCVALFKAVDGWLGLSIPGVGFLATLVLITLVGFLGSNLLTRGAVSVFDGLLNRLPFVSLVYGSTRDLVKAFVGEKEAAVRQARPGAAVPGRSRLPAWVRDPGIPFPAWPGGVRLGLCSPVVPLGRPGLRLPVERGATA